MENSFKNWEIEGDDETSARLTELKNMYRLSSVRIHIPSTSMLPKDGMLFSSKLTMYRIEFGVSDYHPGDEYNKFSRVLMLSFDSPHILWQDWVQTTLQTVEVLYLSGRLDGKCESMDEICIEGFECLKYLQMRECPSFRFIISSNKGSSKNLESLLLDNLESLERLCGWVPRHEEVFSKLRVMKVKSCRKLTHLFDSFRFSSQLEKISVKECGEIQYIVVGEGDDNCEVVTLSKLQKLMLKHLPKLSSFSAGLSSNVLFTGKKVEFPCLESLDIVRLDELEHIWHPTDPPAELGKLRLLKVEECGKLVGVINSNVLMRLQLHLESISIEGCGSMKEVFNVDDAIISSCTDEHLALFSRLKKLRLQTMLGLEGVSNNKNLVMMIPIGGRSMTIFPNIESLFVAVCNHVKYVLCCSLQTSGVGGGGYENLKEIKIEDCEQMEAIVMLSTVDQGTQSAATATATATRGDDTHHQYHYYSFLKEIWISNCPQMRTFCQYLCSEQDSGAAGLPFFSQKEIFPCLESLYFCKLSDKLGEIWPHEVPPQTSFNMLKKIIIDSCWKLSVVFPSTLIARLENLTDVTVVRCVDMIHIIIVIKEKKMSKRRHAVHDGGGSNSTLEETTIVSLEKETDDEDKVVMSTTNEMVFTFLRLRTLCFMDLLKLDRFYSSQSSSACSFRFPSLESLEIERCSEVKTLFSDQRRPTGLVDDAHDSNSDMDEALFTSCDMLAIPNLKSLVLMGSDNLTKIWGEKPEGLFLKLEDIYLNGCYSSYTNLHNLLPVSIASPSFWNVLTYLVVEFSHELEYLLTPVGATCLVHLTSLTIRFCNNIKEVVAVEEEAAAEGNENEAGLIRAGGDHIRDITFRNLKQLALSNLPRFEKFSSVNSLILNFPSLVILDIDGCRKMKLSSMAPQQRQCRRLET